MTDLLKTLTVLVFLVVLLRRRIYIGTVMGIGSVFLALLYLTPPVEFLKGAWRASFAPKSLELTAMLVFTMIMENILRKTGTLKRMVESLSEILPDSRLIMAAMPAMIGMLPSPGGAVFSAPMVGEASARLEIQPDQKAFINYWYRHIWEYVSPLYPGIILVAGLTHLPFRKLALINAPYALSVVFWGAFFCFAGIGTARIARTGSMGRRKALATFTWCIAPILLALTLVVVLGANPVAALGGVTVSLYLVHRYQPSKVWESLRESVSAKALFLVVGIMVFQETLRLTGALAGVSRFFAESGLPPFLVLAALPFLAGLMTGLTIAYVGITFPILMPLMGGDAISPGLVALAFGSGFAGVMLSPVHLCLVLTREYFNADMMKVYHRLWTPSALVLSAALVPLWFAR
jgi:integral membrane protein (TIGR00529 family)